MPAGSVSAVLSLVLSVEGVVCQGERYSHRRVCSVR